MKFCGKVWKFGNNIDTDIIISGRYLSISKANELAKHCFEDVRPEFLVNVRKGDILVAGHNFGCGSSREHAPIALKAAGINCVIAISFARTFYRNSLNIGLPVLECSSAAINIKEGANVEIDTSTGSITDLSEGANFLANPFPEFIEKLIECGGLIPYLKEKIDNIK